MIAFVLVSAPLQIGYMLLQGKRRNGELSLKGIVRHREPIPMAASAQRLAWIYNLHVAPEFRRLGLAKQLLIQAEEWARQQSLGSIGLQVIDFNEPARRLYESMEYNLVATHNESCFYEKKIE